MNEIVWNKEIIIKIQMAQQDIADWNAPLPLFIAAKWHHYIGFYQTLITEFFTSYIPYPQTQQQITLRIPSNNVVLDSTEIVSHLFALYFQESNNIIELICEFRQREVRPSIDLMRFYKQNLKASTSIRYGKFGASVITVDMSVSNIQSMFTNLQKNYLNQFLGELDPASTKLGFKFIVCNQQKIQNVPVRILGQGWRVQRSVKKGTVFSDFWDEIVSNQQNLRPKLHGVSLKYLKINIEKLEQYCHPDGYLYFTL